MPRRFFLLGAMMAALLASIQAPARAEGEHGTVAAAQFVPESRFLQIILRLNPDELKEAITELTHQPMQLADPDAERAVWMVLSNHIQMMDKDGERITLQLKDFQEDEGWVFAIVEFPIPRDTAGLQISDRLFFSKHEDQVNALNVQVGDEDTTLTFTKDKPWSAISLPPADDRGITALPEVVTRGHGPIPMVLVPTHDLDASMYDSFMERNADRYTMYSVTLPGMGGTAPPPKPYAADDTPWIDNDVAAVAQKIRELGLERPVVLGCGLGGIIAYRLGIERGDLVGPIITVDTLPAMVLSPREMTPEMREKAVDRVMTMQFSTMSDEKWEERQRATARLIVTTEDRREEIVDKMIETAPATGKEYMLEHMKVDLHEKLAQIKSPVLIIAAVNDRNQSLASSTPDMKRAWELRLADALRDMPERLELVYIEDCGQFVTEEKPEKLDEVVAKFLAGLKGQGAPAPTP